MLCATLLLFAIPQATELDPTAEPAPVVQWAGAQEGAPRLGPWRAWLDSPGGELPFGLDLHLRVRNGEFRWIAELVNGAEKIDIPVVVWDSDERTLILDMPHYDSRLTAKVSLDGTRLDGRWRKRKGLDRWSDMPFHAQFFEPPLVDGVDPDPLIYVPAPRFLPVPSTPTRPVAPLKETLAQRWRMEFQSSKDYAVGLFQQGEQQEVRGTILTTLGDYRFLAGRRDGTRLRLSCFDGAHAFLFDAQLQDSGTLAGMFYSSDNWQESWTARADPDIALPDAFMQVQLAEGIDPNAPLPLEGLRYLCTDGDEHSLAEKKLHGQVTIISLFGSWCPNCNDEAALWAELHELYYDRGLRIIGLGFELTGEADRDLKQLKRFEERWQLKHPLLLAGTANKKDAQKAFPLIAQVKSYPTALFLDHTGRVRAIHSGFAGPATGPAGERLRERYVELIEDLLAEAGPDPRLEPKFKDGEPATAED
jgi:thiol-disulfide isomerase/thioredoxin